MAVRESEALRAYYLRIIRVGTIATAATVAALALYPVLGDHATDRPGVYVTLLVVAVVGASVVSRLAWPDLLDRGHAMRVLYAWSLLDIVLVSLIIAITGGARSPLFVLYALTTVYFAVSYPRRSQLWLLALTVASFLVVGAATGGVPVDAVPRLGILGVMAFMCSVFAHELQQQVAELRVTHDEAERRITLLAAVTDAAHAMSTLSTDGVLAEVVRALGVMGFDAADLCLLDDQQATYRVVHAAGLPSTYTAGIHRADRGIVARVLAERSTVLLDYGSLPDALPALRAGGLRAVVATPVWDRGRVAAVLEAGHKHGTELARGEVEAVGILAAQASRALENARRFETEQHMVEQLHEVGRMKQDFFSLVSHELRTPLTVITGIGQTLEEQWDAVPPEARSDLLRRLTANAGTLERIVSDLLDFSRLEAQRFNATFEPVALADLVALVTERLSSLLLGHEVTVDVGPVPDVCADPFLLERVVENLLSNAAKHTPPGTQVTVTARAIPTAGEVEVAVADDGPGIAAADLPHLGSLFYRGRAPAGRTTHGLGLGLALVGEVLRLHGSRLEIASEPGQGTRCGFRLRAAESPQDFAASKEGAAAAPR